MTNKELIRRLLISLNKECEDFCFDFEKDSMLYEFDGRQYRIYKIDKEVADTLITRLGEK